MTHAVRDDYTNAGPAIPLRTLARRRRQAVATIFSAARPLASSPAHGARAGGCSGSAIVRAVAAASCCRVFFSAAQAPQVLSCARPALGRSVPSCGRDLDAHIAHRRFRVPCWSSTSMNLSRYGGTLRAHAQVQSRITSQRNHSRSSAGAGVAARDRRFVFGS